MREVVWSLFVSYPLRILSVFVSYPLRICIVSQQSSLPIPMSLSAQARGHPYAGLPVLWALLHFSTGPPTGCPPLSGGIYISHRLYRIWEL